MSPAMALPVIVATALGLVLSAPYNGPVIDLLRVALALPLVLILPGWTLLRALRGPDGAWPLRATMIVAASLAETVIVGLALNELRFAALGSESWAVGLGSLATLQLVVAGFRAPRPETAWPRPNGWHALLLVPVLIASAAVWLSARSAATEPSPPFTQLWLHAEGGSAVAVGVANFEGTGQSYSVVLTDGALGFRRQYAVVLDGGRSWSRVVQVGSGPTASEVTATLYRDGGTNAYRWVSLRVLASTAAPGQP